MPKVFYEKMQLSDTPLNCNFLYCNDWNAYVFYLTLVNTNIFIYDNESLIDDKNITVTKNVINVQIWG